MTLRTLIIRYTTFAIIAGMANLGTQRIILQLDNSILFFAGAVAAGTAVGLLTKYFLDKHWIFFDTSRGIIKHGQKFALYTAMGGMTTCIFWGTETLFWLVWKNDLMRELGAILGLSIGYIVKYNLDRAFVFTNQTLDDQIKR